MVGGRRRIAELSILTVTVADKILRSHRKSTTLLATQTLAHGKNQHRVGRTVAGVVAIRVYLGGQEPRRKGSRQVQRGFEGAPGTASREAGVLRLGLRTRALYRVRNL